MPTLPEVIVSLLLPFEPLFNPRTWRKAQLLTVGAILSPGKRTVSSALNILGVGQRWPWFYDPAPGPGLLALTGRDPPAEETIARTARATR